MERTYFEDKAYDKIDFTKELLPGGEYDNCTFNSCDFSNADLSNISFSECEFAGCNLSMVKLVKTAFKDVKFKDCKLLGLAFDHCSDFLFSVGFDNCILNLSSFFKLKLKKTKFKNSTL
ncbi:MAG TPA: pentapeptide repeat-containing protein, partial [Segetibacter sp.]